MHISSPYCYENNWYGKKNYSKNYEKNKKKIP